MDLVKCIVESIPFYCHKGIPQDGTPKRLCSGFVCLTSAGTEDLRDVLARKDGT
jgi:hypothetical protein